MQFVCNLFLNIREFLIKTFTIRGDAMTKYIIKRLLGMIPTILIIITLSFFIVRIAPGGPFDGERVLTEAVRRNIEARYHFDEPLVKQYARYMFDVLRGDLGPSYKYKDHDVNYLIGNSLPNSIVLGSMAMAVALVFGISLGITAAVKQNTILDYFPMCLAALGLSVPLFVVAPLLQQIFSMQLHWFPTTGWFMTTGGGGWKTAVLPTIALSFAYYADIARLTRSSMLETLRSDYIRTAKAKGMKNSTIIFKHAMKGYALRYQQRHADIGVDSMKEILLIICEKIGGAGKGEGSKGIPEANYDAVYQFFIEDREI